MALSFFEDPARAPDSGELAEALGEAQANWDLLVERVCERLPGVTPEWGYPGKKFGWSLRLKLGKKVVLYMTPGDRKFLASVSLGEKALEKARAGLPAWLLDIIEAAPRYAEGRGVRVETNRDTDVEAIAEVVVVKSTL